MLGGRMFVPPPPPKGAKKYTPPPSLPQAPPPVRNFPNHPPEHHQRPSFSSHPPPPRVERKNCIYVRNVPKRYLQDLSALGLFFNNADGKIKDIKLNAEDNSAVVRYSREEDAIKFVNSKTSILNRSFIIYSLTENQPVPPELVKERENDEAGIIKKSISEELETLRKKIEMVMADKIRALLYLIKTAIDGTNASIQRAFSSK
jgi:hypothetical protein